MPVEQDDPRGRIEMNDLNPILKSIGINPEIHTYAYKRAYHQIKNYPESFIFVGLFAPFDSKAPPDPSWEMRLTSAFASLSSGYGDAARAFAVDKYTKRAAYCLVTNGTSVGGVGIGNRLAKTQANWRLLAFRPEGLDLPVYPTNVSRIVEAGKDWEEVLLKHIDIALMLDVERDTGKVPQFKI